MLLVLCAFLSCASKKTTTPPPQQEQEQNKTPTITKNPDIPIVKMPQRLPLWDDLEAPSDVYQPVAALALSSDHTICYKEWFQGDSLHPHVRKYGGRILNEGEGSIGRMIQCPEERRKELLNALMSDAE